MKKLICLLALAVFLSGCATNNSLQKPTKNYYDVHCCYCGAYFQVPKDRLGKLFIRSQDGRLTPIKQINCPKCGKRLEWISALERGGRKNEELRLQREQKRLQSQQANKSFQNLHLNNQNGEIFRIGHYNLDSFTECYKDSKGGIHCTTKERKF